MNFSELRVISRGNEMGKPPKKVADIERKKGEDAGAPEPKAEQVQNLLNPPKSASSPTYDIWDCLGAQRQDRQKSNSISSSHHSSSANVPHEPPVWPFGVVGQELAMIRWCVECADKADADAARRYRNNKNSVLKPTLNELPFQQPTALTLRELIMAIRVFPTRQDSSNRPGPSNRSQLLEQAAPRNARPPRPDLENVRKISLELRNPQNQLQQRQLVNENIAQQPDHRLGQRQQGHGNRHQMFQQQQQYQHPVQPLMLVQMPQLVQLPQLDVPQMMVARVLYNNETLLIPMLMPHLRHNQPAVFRRGAAPTWRQGLMSIVDFFTEQHNIQTDQLQPNNFFFEDPLIVALQMHVAVELYQRYRQEAPISVDANNNNGRAFSCSFCHGTAEHYADSQPGYRIPDRDAWGPWSTHKLKTNTKVTCPVLYREVCDVCGATGENAHTGAYHREMAARAQHAQQRRQ